MNKARFDETYAENRLKRFRIRDVQAENVKEKKFDLTLIQENVEEFEKKTETAEEDFKEKFEMLKRESDQIKKLKKNQWNVHKISKDAVMSINKDNETFENNVMNIRFDHNVVRNVAVIVKIKN